MQWAQSTKHFTRRETNYLTAMEEEQIGFFFLIMGSASDKINIIVQDLKYLLTSQERIIVQGGKVKILLMGKKIKRKRDKQGIKY